MLQYHVCTQPVKYSKGKLYKLSTAREVLYAAPHAKSLSTKVLADKGPHAMCQQRTLVM